MSGEWLGGMVSAMEVLLQGSTCFPKLLNDFTLLVATYDSSSLLLFVSVLVIVSHSVLAILLNVYWYLILTIVFIFLKTNDRY